ARRAGERVAHLLLLGANGLPAAPAGVCARHRRPVHPILCRMMATAAGTRSISYLQALNEALREEMRRDPKVVVLGEDVVVGGALGILDGLAAEFGTERVINTPISEAGFVGTAIGLAAGGYRPVVDLMFSPFMWCAMDQCCNQAAKWRYMSGGQV